MHRDFDNFSFPQGCPSNFQVSLCLLLLLKGKLFTLINRNLEGAYAKLPTQYPEFQKEIQEVQITIHKLIIPS